MTFSPNNDLLVIPDVHGRGFWREAVEQDNWSHVLFLGDYTDPYPHEMISVDEAYANFLEILKFACAHTEQVTLLLGNHDMHYMSAMFRRLAKGSRYSNRLSEKYAALFHTHASLFSLAFEAEYEGEKCLFTHAGVVPEWYSNHADLIGELTASHINQLLATAEGNMALSEVGWCRGGLALAGGPLWADCSEMTSEEGWPYQIFGHTQNLEEKAVVTPHFACVDTHRAYLLSEILGMR